ncbi:MAG: hypothetical protein AB1791_15175 [Chloroflexota bacterium]
MEIQTSLLQLTEQAAVCAATIQNEAGRVTVYATGLAAESGRYADLAQARALALAQQVLTRGVETVAAEAYLVPLPPARPPAIPTPSLLPTQIPPVEVVELSPTPAAQVVTSDANDAILVTPVQVSTTTQPASLTEADAPVEAEAISSQLDNIPW